MEVINIDTIGPLTKDAEGYEYILVIIDCFTRWVEIYPLKDVSAKSAAVKLLEFTGRFGIPTKCRSDRGSQFVNEVIHELFILLEVEHEFTMAYSKEENGIVERANREVNRHLRDLLWDKRVYDQWSFACIPLVMRIINSEVKTSTGCSPAQLLYGDAVNLHVNMFKKLNKPVTVNYDYFRNLVKMQDILLTVAAELQKDTDLYHLNMRKTSDSSNIDIELAVNGLVLWDDPARSTPKLQYAWQGPFLILKKEGNEITLQCLINHKIWTTHVNRVRPYLYDAKLGFPSPEETAARDLNEFFVEKIKDHKLIESNANITSVVAWYVLVLDVLYDGFTIGIWYLCGSSRDTYLSKPHTLYM